MAREPWPANGLQNGSRQAVGWSEPCFVVIFRAGGSFARSGGALSTNDNGVGASVVRRQASLGNGERAARFDVGRTAAPVITTFVQRR